MRRNCREYETSEEGGQCSVKRVTMTGHQRCHRKYDEDEGENEDEIVKGTNTRARGKLSLTVVKNGSCAGACALDYCCIVRGCWRRRIDS